jgi:two-component system, NtrC family, sensor kinase
MTTKPISPNPARPRRRKLRRDVLVLLAVVLAIAAAGLSTSLYSLFVNTERSAWDERLAQATSNTRTVANRFINDIFNQLYILSQADPEQLSSTALRDLLNQNSAFDEIVVVNADGTLRAHYSQGQDLLTNTFTLQQAQWLISARGGGTYLSNLQLTGNARPYVITSRPAIDNGVIAARLDLTSIANQLNQNILGKTGVAYIANEEGQVLIHSRVGWNYDGQNVAGRYEYEQAKSAVGRPWIGFYKNFENSDQLGAVAFVPGRRWMVFTEVTQSEANVNSRQALIVILLSTFLGIGLIVVGGYLSLTYFIFRPLANLRRGTNAVEQGDLTHQVPITRNDELGALGQSFNAMVARVSTRESELRVARDEAITASKLAQENARLKSEFLATMSHELRTPLNAIEGFTSIMLGGMGVELEPKAYNMVERVSANSKRLLSLINDFLDLSRIESGRLEIVKSTINPRDLAERWRSQTQVLADKKNLAFEIDIDSALPKTLLSDEDALSKIAVNLLSNAFKFTQTGTVKLQMYPLREDGKLQWQLVVSDTGIGIPAHAREFIFEEFRQVDGSSRRLYGGTGLGLAIVQKLTRLMGGTVLLQSEVDKGSTFTITLPLETSEENPVLTDTGKVRVQA